MLAHKVDSFIFSKQVAWLVEEALLTEMLNNNIPPLRLTVMMLMTVPMNNPKCLDWDCTNTSCKGNRLEVLDKAWMVQEPMPANDTFTSDSFSVASLFATPKAPISINKIKVVVEHHKMKVLGDSPITFTLPKDLCILTHKFLKHCHPTITLVSNSKVLFPTSTGKPQDHMSIRNMWLNIQTKHKAPWTPFNPRMTRHIYSDDCIEQMAKAVATMPPSESSLVGSTYIMGNSTKVCVICVRLCVLCVCMCG
jgi:hypothetical protein